jgi:hypothetical protein
MNKFEYKRLCPFKWYVLQNFPFIEADFDAITNYQLYCKVVEYLNKILDNVNVIGNQMEEVTNAFIELQNYVNNYFENLDVQEEINNKLDEMAQDGTLQNIIKNVLPYKHFPNICASTYISGNWNDEKAGYQSFYNLGGRKAQIVQNVALNVGTQTWTIGDIVKLNTVIDELRNMGYTSLMLKIHISFSNGSLNNQTDEQLLSLLQGYQNILLQYAQICEDKEIDYFIITNENPYFTTNNTLVSTWIDIYNGLRNIYNGKISHSMTINESKSFLLYELVDVICFNLYPSLSYNPNASIYECMSSRDLNNSFIQINNIKNSYNKPIIITETGCEAQYGRLAEPGRFNANTSSSNLTQYIYYKVIFDYIKNNAMFIQDIYLWEVCYSFNFLNNNLVTNLISNINNGGGFDE